ncbi:hypothetical protein Hanom_Chr08g00692521 [Helianthus anomalus]
MQNYYRAVDLTESSLSMRGKAVYILQSSDPTLALLLVRFTEYDKNDEFGIIIINIHIPKNVKT